jgi:hypothetical protein
MLLISCTTAESVYVALDKPFDGEILNGVFRSSGFAHTTVPVPAAAWLFGSALGLLGWMRRRRNGHSARGEKKMNARKLGALCAALLSLGLVSTANATLWGVLPATSGGTDWLAYYDNQLDITWMADANATTTTTWDGQRAWADGLDIGGITGWRLPSADVNGDNVVIDCDGGGIMGCADNELGYLFWEEGITFDTPSPFTNLQATEYWTDTELSSDTTQGWRFFFDQTANEGRTTTSPKTFNNAGWAVHDGNPGGAVVPVPAAVWLFGSALGLLGWIRRKAA